MTSLSRITHLGVEGKHNIDNFYLRTGPKLDCCKLKYFPLYVTKWSNVLSIYNELFGCPLMARLVVQYLNDSGLFS